MAKRTFKTREQWLNAAAKKLQTQFFARTDHPIPGKLRVSCGFAFRSPKAIGQCWSPKSSTDETTEMFICPTQSDPVRVLDILLHEMIHAAVGVEEGHKGNFRKMALDFGLRGKMTATYAEEGSDLHKRLMKLASSLGQYPHSALAKKGGGAMRTPKREHISLKSETEGYEDYRIGMLKALFEEFGAPSDPAGNPMVPSKEKK